MRHPRSFPRVFSLVVFATGLWWAASWQTGAAVPLARCDVPIAVNRLSVDELQKLPKGRSAVDLLKVAPVVGDFNGDGCQDVASTQPNGQGLSIRGGFGDGSTGSMVLIDGFPVSAMRTADVDLDGITDIMVGGLGGDVEVLSGGFDGTKFKSTSGFKAPGAVIDLAPGRFGSGGDKGLGVLWGLQGGASYLTPYRFTDSSSGLNYSPQSSYSVPGAKSLFVKPSSLYGAPLDGQASEILVGSATGVSAFRGNGTDPYQEFPLRDFNPYQYAAQDPPKTWDDLSNLAKMLTPDSLRAPSSADDVLYRLAGIHPTALAPVRYNDDMFPDWVAGASTPAGGMLKLLIGGQNGTLSLGPTFPLPQGFSPFELTPGDFVDGVPTSDVLLHDPETGDLAFLGSPYPGAPFGINPLPFGPIYPQLSLSSLPIPSGSTAKGPQTFVVEIEATIVPEDDGGPVFGAPGFASRWLGWLAFFRPPSGDRLRFDTAANAFPRGAQASSRQTAAPDAVLRPSIVSLGSSTGDAFTLRLSNPGAGPVRMLHEVVVLEPIAGSAPPPSRTRGIETEVEGYCLDFTRETPPAGMPFRLADKAAQARIAPMRRILDAAKDLGRRQLLHPDSDPAEYVTAIKQWALWTERERWDQKKFGDAFLARTKKNMAALNQPWTRAVEDTVRGAVPGRWKDITAVLGRAASLAR